MGNTPKQVKYRQQFVRCGKPKCLRCNTGPGHGPYWYAIWREGEHVRTRYVGKQLPAEISTASLRGDLAALVPVGSAAVRRAQLHISSPALAAGGATHMPPAASFSIRMLGQFRVERNGVLIPRGAWRRRSAVLLFKMLLLADKRQLPRDAATERLWPGMPAAEARPKLATSIYALRRALEPDLVAGQLSRYVIFDGRSITLQLGASDWVDIVSFQERLDRATQDDDPLPDLQAAMTIYGGDLLPGEHGPWCTPLREALRLRWHAGLLALAEAQAGRRQYDAACATLGRLVQIDPALEEASRRLMALLAQQGRRVDALRLYSRLEKALRNERNLEPEPMTVALATSLREGDPQPSLRGVRPATPEPGAYPLPALPPLVGRSAETARIRAAIEATQLGDGRLLVLKGVAGIGKTRLAHEAGSLALALGYTVLSGRGSESEHDLPYAPVVKVLRQLFSSRSTAANLRGIQGAEAILDVLPELAHVIQISVGTIPQRGSGPERRGAWNAIVSTLMRGALSQPLLLVLEDLQWFDAQSLGILASLLQRLQETRILVLVTIQDDLPASHSAARLVGDAAQDTGAEIIDVPSLTRDEVAQLAAGLLGTDLASNLVAALYAQCGGNPLFITELLALARRRAGDVGKTEGLAALLADETQLPTTILQVIGRRLDRLNAECRALLQAGAVMGDSMSGQFLARVMHRDEQEVAGYLQEAVEADILLAPESTYPGEEYHFVHGLVRRALYTELPHTYRQRLHAQVAAVLAEHTTLDNEPPTEQIARHFALSQNHFAAALWLERAGDRAAAMHAETEAGTHYAAATQRLALHDRWAEGDHHQAMAERLRVKLEKLGPSIESRSMPPAPARDQQRVTG